MGTNLILYPVPKGFNQLIPVKSHLHHFLKNLLINLQNHDIIWTDYNTHTREFPTCMNVKCKSLKTESS